MMKIECDEPLTLSGSELSAMRFRMASQVVFSEQSHRGEIWVVIQNTLSNKHFTTTPLVRNFVELFREEVSLQSVMDTFLDTDQLPAEQWVELISKLLQADILSSSDMDQDDHRLQQFLEREKKVARSKWAKPWMFKIPLGNPNAILTYISRHTPFLWSKPVFIFWVAIVLFGVVEAVGHFSDLQEFWSARFLDPMNLALALIIYPVLKFFHELGHGLAAKHWGGDVVETGVLLILFVPLPYIDVSQSAFFKNKSQRMVVAAAGMMFELSLAVVALFVWISVDSIFVRDVCLNILLIGAVSSIFFNANPLLKFDGYYLLSDFLEIPNLSTRATQMCKYYLYRNIFRIPVAAVASSIAEAKVLLTYGVLSQAYRLAISFYIALYLGSHYFFIGVAMGAWLLVNQLLKPWFLGLRALLDAASEHSVSKRVESLLAIMGAVMAVAFFMIPWQLSHTVNGVFVLDGTARVQAQATGFVDNVLVKHNQYVEVGEPLLNLINASIPAELEYLRAKIKENQTLANQFLALDPAQAAYYSDQVNAYSQEWDNLNQEAGSMVVRSPVSGTFQGLSSGDLKGRFLEKGDVLGSVVSSENMSAILMLTEEEMLEVDKLRQAHVYVPSLRFKEYRVLDVEATPSATDQLPSRYLGSLYGGEIPTDSNDNEGLRLIKPMFEVKVRIDMPEPAPVTGSKVIFKLDNSSKTLGQMALNKVKMTLRDQAIID